MAELPELVDHLFRREAGKLTAYLSRMLGLSRLEMAEDVVQDTLCRALEIWPVKGFPAQPTAWLMRVARNRALDLLRRDSQLDALTPELGYLQQLRKDTQFEGPDFELAIQDDQLRMMFACCHPQLSAMAQVSLILKTLCGFSVAEIAHALLAHPDAVEKRLSRARKVFRESGVSLDLNPLEIPDRLEAVYQAIYLLFNEGYHASRSAAGVREDLCFEALRLAVLLSEHPLSQQSKTSALLALFCFQTARLNSRFDLDGELLQLAEQDRSRWDAKLIRQGFVCLEQAIKGPELSAYHLEAVIAALHCSAASHAETDWAKILEHYDLLYRLKPTPIVALNRAIALGFAQGPEAGMTELEDLPDLALLRDYPFYPAALAEFSLASGQLEAAQTYFQQALALARNPSEVRFFSLRLKLLKTALSSD